MFRSLAARRVVTFRILGLAAICAVALAGCDRWPESDEGFAERFDTRLRGELRNAVSSKQPVRLEKVASFSWDTVYFYSATQPDPNTPVASVPLRAAEGTGSLGRKDLDVVIVFMDKGQAVRTVTRLHGNTGVAFKVSRGMAIARDAAVFDLVENGAPPLAELRIKTG